MTLATGPGSALLTGLASSLGPCAGPRFVAVSAALGRRAHVPTSIAFVAGTLSAYGLLAGVGVALGTLGTHVLYAATSAVLLWAGFDLLLRSGHRCARYQRSRGGAAFFLGLSCSTVSAPCCASVAAALGLQAVASGPIAAAGTVGAFALGQALPILGLLVIGNRVRERFHNIRFEEAAATLGGALLIGLSLLYAVTA